MVPHWTGQTEPRKTCLLQTIGWPVLPQFCITASSIAKQASKHRHNKVDNQSIALAGGLLLPAFNLESASAFPAATPAHMVTRRLCLALCTQTNHLQQADSCCNYFQRLHPIVGPVLVSG